MAKITLMSKNRIFVMQNNERVKSNYLTEYFSMKPLYYLDEFLGQILQHSINEKHWKVLNESSGCTEDHH